MQLILLSSDLMLASAAQGAADRHGAGLTVTADASAALKACSDGATRLLVVDLRTPALDIDRLVSELRSGSSANTHVMACAPHVHEALLERAAAAGCDEVVSRGEVERRLNAALERLASAGG